MLRSSTTSYSATRGSASRGATSSVDASVAGWSPAGSGRRWARRASSAARSPSRARSRGPRRHRGPPSSRSSAEPAVASPRTCRVATTSATSGRTSRPPRPTTSTGTPRSLNACSRRGKAERLRLRTAISPQATPRSCAATSRSATSAASSATVSTSAHSTSPVPARPGPGTSGRCASPSTGRPAATAFATVRMASPLRNDWVRPLSRLPPKSAPNRWRLPALAPRQP